MATAFFAYALLNPVLRASKRDARRAVYTKAAQEDSSPAHGFF